LRCVELAMLNPPHAGEYRVFNQFTEQFSIVELAKLIVCEARKLGLEASTQRLPNPRVEAEAHYYKANAHALRSLGLKPTLLSETLVTSLMRVVHASKDRVNLDLINPTVRWADTQNTLAGDAAIVS
jgi:UDP-sulfoquinovose synthase